jgi:DNA-binding IclR family transcriptional regulator
VSLVTLKTARHGPSIVRVRRPSERRSLSRSATRALDVLEAFGEEQRPLRAVEVARLLDLPSSTTDQLLKTMVDSGHLVFEARAKTYVPSPRLLGFAGWIVVACKGEGGLGALIREVQARTGLVTTLSAPNDLFMQVIDVAVPPEISTERGLRVSVFGTVIGSAYLSMLESREIQRLADRARIAPGELPVILETVNAIRAEGFADGPTPDGGIWSIAMPISTPGLRVPLVLGVAGPREPVVRDREALLRAVREELELWLRSSSGAARASEPATGPPVG